MFYQRVMIVEGPTNWKDVMSIKGAHRTQVYESDIILAHKLQKHGKSGLLSEKWVSMKDRYNTPYRVVPREEVETIKRYAETLTTVTRKVSF
jgi:hypothetical protein